MTFPTNFLILLTISAIFGVNGNIYNVDFSHLGPIFDGIGALSGGGATSKLLYSVNETIRLAVLKELFNPKTGLHILKIELGGEDQSTDGSEASHWPTYDNFDFKRGYEWKLVRDALKINPKLKMCVLPWAFPSWVGTPNDNPVNASKYVVRWIVEAYNLLKVETYCVGIWNERSWTEEYVITLRNTLDAAKLPFRTQIVVADDYETSEKDFKRMLAPNFTDYVDIIGVHYPGGKLPDFVQSSGKTLWSSEEFSTPASSKKLTEAFGCMGRTINWNYVHGNMTGTIIWHLVSSFYSSFPYYGASIWVPYSSDYLSYGPTDAMMALFHTIGWVRPGWRFLEHEYGAGKLDHGGTYVTYTDGENFTIVIETMEWKKSLCFYSDSKPFLVASVQNVSFSLKNLPTVSKFYKYENGTVEKLEFQNGILGPVEIHHNSIVTIWGSNSLPDVNPPQGIKVISENCQGDYFDDYSGYENGDEARWLSPQKGVWLVYDGILKQTVLTPPVSWCAGDINTPVAVMPGTSVSIDVMRPFDSSPYPFLGLNTNCTGCDIKTCLGLFVTVDQNGGKLFTNFSSWNPVATFLLDEPFTVNQWYRFVLKAISSSQILVTFGSTTRAFSKLIFPANGTVAVGSTGYGETHWDNLFIENVFNQ